MPSEASLGELLSAVSGDVSALVRNEIALAKAELRDDVKKAGVAGGMFGAAAVLALLALGLLSFAMVYGFNAAGLGLAWSFLVGAAALLLLVGALAFVGLRFLRGVRPPERAIKSARESIAALRTRDASRKAVEA